MDVVLVGLPGCGKTAAGRRLARRHEAEFIDLDGRIEATAGAPVPAIFEAEGEAGFRDREAAAIRDLGPADQDARVRRVIATGGGAVVDPRNRWRLYRGRVPVWLDVRAEVLAQRLRRSHNVRPLIAASRDPHAALLRLRTTRERFYAAATRVDGVADAGRVLAAIDAAADATLAGGPARGTRLLDAVTAQGRLVIGDGIAATAVADALDAIGGRRAFLISEPTAWRVAGAPIADALRAAGRAVEPVLLPEGEAAKRLSVIEVAARTLAAARAERGEPIVAVGGGALGDAAGLLAAVWLRGVPLVHVPTTLVAQIDSSIGGKTGVDLPEGKNLLGAFHRPAAIVIDPSLLRTLPERHRRAALGEAAKMAVLGDERLFALLERDGAAIARGDETAFESGAVAELVERCAWAKVEVVMADERETATDGRITLNLGHSIGHALEAADGYADLLHGEAVASGLLGACRIARTLDLLPAGRAARIESLLERLGLTRPRFPYPLPAVLEAMGRDKKHAGGRLRWVLPTADGVIVRDDVPAALVESVTAGLLSGATT